MKRKFLLSIALALMYSVAGAQNFRCTHEEYAVYQRHSDEILRLTWFRTGEECARLDRRYYIPKDKRQQIERYVSNREFHKVCLEFMLPDSLQQRVTRKIRLDEHYQDSIDMVLIPEAVNKISGDNISLALQGAAHLRLDSAQYSYMLAKALDMTHRIRKNRSLNVWNEEMDILRKTLSKEQFGIFFRNKNAVTVSREADAAWKRIQDAGLTEQLDSVKEMGLAISYFNERQKIKDIYRYYGTAQKKYLAELSRQMPTIIKMTDALDKKARMDESERKAATIGKEFVW